jgi:hypothetical protein
MSYIYNS